jgi:hypothetical protein
MADDLISVIDLAKHYGKRKQSIFKILKRLGVEATKRQSANSRGQVIAYITSDEARLVVADLTSARSFSESDGKTEGSIPEVLLAEQGVFYLLQLEPNHDSGRFKVGFATSLPERLRQLRCSAPLTTVVRTWPCKRLWEKTAIECVAEGCERLHTEVFRTTSLESVITQCERFFELMPKLPSKGLSA